MIGKVWTTTLGVVALAAASLPGAPSASAAGAPTITAYYAGMYVNFQNVVQPVVVITGTGFFPAPAGESDKRFAVSYGVRPDTGGRFGDDSSSTLERKVCTHTVPSSCIVQYQAGELREPMRLFLGSGSPGVGRDAVCGDVVTVRGYDLATRRHPTVVSNEVTVRVPCDTYTPRPPRRIP